METICLIFYINFLCYYYPDLFCMHFGFWHPYISFHFYLRCFFTILVSIVFLNGGIFFVDYKNTGGGYNHIHVHVHVNPTTKQVITLTPQCLQHNYIHRHNYKASSSLTVSLLCTSIIYELMIILFHLQMMTIFYFTYRIVCSLQLSKGMCVLNLSLEF